MSATRPAKDCGNHGHRREKLFRRLFGCLLAFIILVLFIILVIWVVLRPTKPRFVLQDASVWQLNVTAPYLLTTSLQVTIYSRNPNDKIGIYYDKLDAYATYRNQQITLRSTIPPTFQGHNDVNIWSPFLYGGSIPVAPYIETSLTQDQGAGLAVLNVKIDGRLRWKVGTWISGHYRIYVNCPAVMAFNCNGVCPAASVRLSQGSQCSTDV